MTITISDIQLPYFVTSEALPGLDFNREVILPGKSEHFPDGAIGIRVDGDFWSVAAIPYKYVDASLHDIVLTLWPQYIDQATFEPDSGSVEQKIRFVTLSAESKERKIKSLNNRVHELQDELDRLRAGRHDLHERHSIRHRAYNDYFVRQYEHLLIAVAHKASPFPDKQGVCSTCGLLITDRIHMQHYQDLHDAGYAPAMKHLTEYKDE